MRFEHYSKGFKEVCTKYKSSFQTYWDILKIELKLEDLRIKNVIL